MQEPIWHLYIRTSDTLAATAFKLFEIVVSTEFAALHVVPEDLGGTSTQSDCQFPRHPHG
jgi:hypothetical protein